MISFRVQVGDNAVDCGVESIQIGEGFVGEIEGFEVMPDHFDAQVYSIICENAKAAARAGVCAGLR